MSNNNELFHCDKCGKDLKAINFFTYKTGSKLDICKKCMGMHIDNFKPETFLWVLEKMDVPYIPNEWQDILDKEIAKRGIRKINGLSVVGKYLSKMRLNQWGKYTWADTERLQKEYNERYGENEEYQKREEMRKKFENGEISEAQYLTYTSTSSLVGSDMMNNYSSANTNFEDFIGGDNYYNENKFIAETDLPSADEQLTQDDKVYLAMKWGRLYTADQWVSLEKKYEEMKASFDIQDSDTEGTLIMLCKTYLKANEALDQSDIESYQKLQKSYNDLRKSAKFTAAQNKEEMGNFVDSIGEIVAYCEKEGGRIPRYDTSIDYDIFDKVIADLKDYNKDLIYQDVSLARQIEDYIKKKIALDEMAENRAKAKEMGLEAIPLTPEDYLEFSDQIDEEKFADSQLTVDEEDNK